MQVGTLKGIYSNKEMKAISSYIMYVMNKMELFHNANISGVYSDSISMTEPMNIISFLAWHYGNNGYIITNNIRSPHNSFTLWAENTGNHC